MNPIFFDKDNNTSADEFRQFLPVNVNTDFDVLAPSIADAEQKYIVPILGSQLTATLDSYYHGSDSSDTIKNNLIERIQSAVIRIAYYESFDLLSVNITESGLQDINGDNRVYRYQADRAKDTLAHQAFEHLQYFYDALVASNLRTWDASDPNNPRPTDSVFRDYREFFRAVRMEPDFRLFAKISQWIQSADMTVLPHHVGAAIANSIIAREQRITPAILSLAQRLVGFSALAKACKMLHGYLTSEGVVVRSMRTDGGYAGFSTNPADASTRTELANSYQELSDSAATELVSLLRSNESSFPEIKAVSSRDEIRHFVPTKNKKSFRV